MAVPALEMKTCQPFASGRSFGDVGPYEQLDGTVHGAVDLYHPGKAGIPDLRRAPRDVAGLVHYSADFHLPRPVAPSRGNQRLLLDIVNRGNPTVLSVKNIFPFYDTRQTDPETGRTDGLLAHLEATGKVPKIFFINTSAEYWGGYAALTHIDVDGKRDLVASENVRLYHLAGTQHTPGNLQLTDTGAADDARGQHRPNSVDYRPLLRAAPVPLDRWVTAGQTPPPSQHPRLADGTVVPPEHTAVAFQALLQVHFPTHLRSIARLDFGLETEEDMPTLFPPKVGTPYPNLVSAVDADGNEVVGIRLPDISVSLATYTGWNVRHTAIGGPRQTLALLGSTLPFPATQAVREASGEPRLSIEERYPTRGDYLRQVQQAAAALVQQGYLLDEDIATLTDQAAQRYDLFYGRVSI